MNENNDTFQGRRTIHLVLGRNAVFLSETYDDRIVGKHAQNDFLNRRQIESESIRQYAICFQRSTEAGCAEKLEQFIISRFVNGLLNSSIQREMSKMDDQDMWSCVRASEKTFLDKWCFKENNQTCLAVRRLEMKKGCP
ncbi:hypothetical protein RF11_02014 [Thelohanellus kitauei]|uniref:Uncharacterized protein n=1 Tax=Thelohanellus kitauei TaxID=669202 RepID=A0A0C2N2B0_THEKT|nr:hypothetical protein RF11_02014 [Thelohanellus kitauei]